MRNTVLLDTWQVQLIDWIVVEKILFSVCNTEIFFCLGCERVRVKAYPTNKPKYHVFYLLLEFELYKIFSKRMINSPLQIIICVYLVKPRPGTAFPI